MKEAKAVVWAAKIAERRAALGERVLWLAAERMAAVASKATADALQGKPPPTAAKAVASTQRSLRKVLKRSQS